MEPRTEEGRWVIERSLRGRLELEEALADREGALGGHGSPCCRSCEPRVEDSQTSDPDRQDTEQENVGRR